MLYTAIFFVLLNLSGVIHVEAFNCRFCSKLNLLIDKVDKLLDLEHKGEYGARGEYSCKNLCGDVWHACWNPYPISDQNKWSVPALFQTWTKPQRDKEKQKGVRLLKNT